MFLKGVFREEGGGGVASETPDMTQYVSDGYLSKYIGAEVVVLS